MRPDFLNRSQPQCHLKSRVSSWHFNNPFFSRLTPIHWPRPTHPHDDLTSVLRLGKKNFFRNLPLDLTNRGIWSDLASDIIWNPAFVDQKKSSVMFFFPRRTESLRCTAPQSIWEKGVVIDETPQGFCDHLGFMRLLVELVSSVCSSS